MRADADKFDKLAKMAIGKQITAENEAKAVEPTIASQTDVVEKLKAGLDGMRDKLGELTSKRDELIARAKTAQAQAQVADALQSIDVLDPTSELGRFEEKVRREEAMVAGKQEIAASKLDVAVREPSKNSTRPPRSTPDWPPSRWVNRRRQSPPASNAGVR